MDVRAKATWRGRDLSKLSDADVSEAIRFCDDVYRELQNWAPISVWSYFSALLADLTIEQAKRSKG